MTSPSSPHSPRLASFIDRIYASPLDAFTETRKTLVAELRAVGASEDAKLLAAMRKPSRSAWALGQLARHRPADLERFLAATERVRRAQALAVKERDPAALREAVRAFKASIAEIVGLASRELAGSDGGATAAQQRAIGTTLQAIPFATADEIDALTRGTLATDLEPSNDLTAFGLIPAAPAEEKAGGDDRAKKGAEAAAREAERAEARRVAAETRRREREAARLAKIADDAEEEANRLGEAAAAAAKHARALEEQAREARLEAARARTAARAAR